MVEQLPVTVEELKPILEKANKVKANLAHCHSFRAQLNLRRLQLWDGLAVLIEKQNHPEINAHLVKMKTLVDRERVVAAGIISDAAEGFEIVKATERELKKINGKKLDTSGYTSAHSIYCSLKDLPGILKSQLIQLGNQAKKFSKRLESEEKMISAAVLKSATSQLSKKELEKIWVLQNSFEKEILEDLRIYTNVKKGFLPKARAYYSHIFNKNFEASIGTMKLGKLPPATHFGVAAAGGVVGTLAIGGMAAQLTSTGQVLEAIGMIFATLLIAVATIYCGAGAYANGEPVDLDYRCDETILRDMVRNKARLTEALKIMAQKKPLQLTRT